MQNNVNHFDEKNETAKKNYEKNRKKKNVIYVRFDDDDYDVLHSKFMKAKLAYEKNSNKKSSLTMTEFVRQSCLKSKVTEPQQVNEIIKQIKIIGRNVHGVLKVANSTKTINQTELDKLNLYVGEFNKLWQSLRR